MGESGDTLTVNPIKQTRINTQAMVEVGQSLLIGGYYYEQKSEGDSGVPILKDIPILGHLFKSSSTSGRQMERLILITPRIVTAEGENVPSRVNQPGFGRNATSADYEWKRSRRPTHPPTRRTGRLICARPYSNSSRDCTPEPGSNSPKETG